MRDYRERTIVAKNRPKKGGARNGLTGLVCGVAVVCFLLGVVTGGLVFRGPRPLKGGATPQAATAQPGAVAVPNAAPAQASPPLTFYDTLEKGGKVPLGTGLNPAHKETLAELPAAAPKSVPPPAAGAVTPVIPVRPQPAVPVSKPVPPSPPAVALPKPAAGALSVQVSAHQNRQEAETVRGNLVAKGFDAYLVPVQVAGKGTMYRIRVGRHLDQAKAKELAAKLGKGALIIPE